MSNRVSNARLNHISERIILRPDGTAGYIGYMLGPTLVEERSIVDELIDLRILSAEMASVAEMMLVLFDGHVSKGYTDKIRAALSHYQAYEEGASK